jgi:hypothetical protein
MTDDEIVTIVAQALGRHDHMKPYHPDRAKGHVDDARAALAALRKTGCEVVVWGDVAAYYASSGPTPAGIVTFPRYGKTTHYAILTGPESNNG